MYDVSNRLNRVVEHSHKEKSTERTQVALAFYPNVVNTLTTRLNTANLEKWYLTLELLDTMDGYPPKVTVKSPPR